MSLSIGSRLGPYEITAAIGAGGMGEVFRARDTKLNRDVAIKVLPDAFAHDAERLARFTREAQTLASLNHPNIAAIYGIEDVPAAGPQGSDSRALIMELVDGDDLAAILTRGRIPLHEAVAIARQIAEALEAAHDQAIVHRDLKPANVKVRGDGTVKVLDFGLAKTLSSFGGASSAGRPSAATDLGASAGMIIGTVGYMSPEQARAKPVDRRADIWSFGVVLWEMLSGQPAFKGDDASETLASVLKDSLSPLSLPPQTPPEVKWLIGRCLDRDLRTRLRDIGEARVILARLEGSVTQSGATTLGRPDPIAAVPRWRRLLPWAPLVLLAGLAPLMANWPSRPRASAPALRRLLISVGANAALAPDLGASAVLSPDGTTLAFVARQADTTRLYVRGLDQLQAAAVAGTDGATGPFFSPDGRWIAFFAGGKLKKVPVTGGVPVTLCEAPAGRGGAWTEDNSIVFMPTNTSNTKLMRIEAGGGAPSAFGAQDGASTMQRWPQALPGGRGLLYTAHSTSARFDGASLVVAPMAGGAPKVVVRGGYYGRYVASGHLVYMQQGTLFAVPFDLDRLETTGPAVPALEGVAADPATGGAQVSLSSDGTLVYLPGATTAAANPMDWMTREGGTSVLRAARAEWANPRFAPDGRALALNISDGKQHDIWVYEWTRETLTQLTFDPADDRVPVWTPDGNRVVFSSDRAQPGVSNLYWVNADGTGYGGRLTNSPEDQAAGSWHPGGKVLAFHANRGAGSWDLMLLPVTADKGKLLPGPPTTFLSTEANEMHPMFSPDGKWVAYASDESGGNFDVYVRPYPGPGGKWRVSTGGGNFPRWSPSSRDLVFLNQGRVMVSPYAVVGESFRAEAPRAWSPVGYQGLSTGYPYDLHPDGSRVAIMASRDRAAEADDKAVLFLGFGDYLKRLAPVAK